MALKLQSKMEFWNGPDGNFVRMLLVVVLSEKDKETLVMPACTGDWMRSRNKAIKSLFEKLAHDESFCLEVLHKINDTGPLFLEAPMGMSAEHKIELWHDSESEKPAHEYLGMTKEEFSAWAKGVKAPK